jgi:hypothetical protein
MPPPREPTPSAIRALYRGLAGYNRRAPSWRARGADTRKPDDGACTVARGRAPLDPTGRFARWGVCRRVLLSGQLSTHQRGSGAAGRSRCNLGCAAAPARALACKCARVQSAISHKRFSHTHEHTVARRRRCGHANKQTNKQTNKPRRRGPPDAPSRRPPACRTHSSARPPRLPVDHSLSALQGCFSPRPHTRVLAPSAPQSARSPAGY